MNLPNKITMTRIFLSIILLVMLLIPWYSFGVTFPAYQVATITVDLKYVIAGIIFFIASSSDFLDGYLARKNNEVTDLGKMLDAIADKVLVNSALIILASKGFMLTLIPVIIIFRDTVVDAMKMEAARKGKVVAAISSGKIKTASMMVGVTLTFFYNLPFEMINIRVSDFFLYFATIMSIVSMCEYYKLNKKLILPTKKKA